MGTRIVCGSIACEFPVSRVRSQSWLTPRLRVWCSEAPSLSPSPSACRLPVCLCVAARGDRPGHAGGSGTGSLLCKSESYTNVAARSGCSFR